MTATVLEIHLPALHAGQQQIVAESARWNVANCGRRFGKTTLGIDRMVPPLTERLPVAWFSPTYKMLADVWRETRRVLQPWITRTNTQEKRLEIIGGGLIDFWSLDTPDVARGRKYARVIIDEAAMVRDLETAWNEVIRPTLTDYQGDAWFLSTPKGRNFYWTLWQRGQDPEQPDWASWLMPSIANPYLEPSEIESARRELPELSFAQEYLAQFIEDGSGVFRNILACATATRQSTPQTRHQYVMGVDWGKHNDFTVITVMDANERAMVAMERFNQIDYTTQTNRLIALVETFGPIAIIAERNSMGEPLIEHLLRRGLPVYPFTTTNATKGWAIDALALAFERDDIRILHDPVLINELQAFEATRLPSGMLRYAAPDGMHDDCVMSLALAWSVLAETAVDDGTYMYSEPVQIGPQF